MDTKLIGQRIKQIREEKGVRREDITEKLKISDSAYQRIESGNSNSWAVHLWKICDILDIEPSELLKREDGINQASYDNVSAVQSYANQDTHIIINQISDKLTDLFEKMFTDLKAEIKELKEKLKDN